MCLNNLGVLYIASTRHVLMEVYEIVGGQMLGGINYNHYLHVHVHAVLGRLQVLYNNTKNTLLFTRPMSHKRLWTVNIATIGQFYTCCNVAEVARHMFAHAHTHALIHII